MRQMVVGAALLVGALVVTFATASILQGMAVQKRAIIAEPFTVDKVTPAATVNRTPSRTEPGRSVVLASRSADM